MQMAVCPLCRHRLTLLRLQKHEQTNTARIIRVAFNKQTYELPLAPPMTYVSISKQIAALFRIDKDRAKLVSRGRRIADDDSVDEWMRSEPTPVAQLIAANKTAQTHSKSTCAVQ